MASSPINELLQAVEGVRRRRSLLLHLRQIGWSLAILSAVLILSGLLAMTLPPVPAVSILLFCALALAVAVLVWWYGRAMRRFDVEDRRLAQYIDERMPGLKQRLLTAMDVQDKQAAPTPSQLVASLWRDTLDHVTGENLQRTADTRPTWIAAGAALIPILMLTGALWYSDRFAGATRRVVWPWSTGAMYAVQTADFEVFPGDILIRRGSDVTISVTTNRARSKVVSLHIRKAAGAWQPLVMQNSDAAKRFFYLLPGVTGDMDYYVDSGYRRSRQFRIQVFDLTQVESIQADYRYPAYTGMQAKTEKDAGDLLAPEGTRIRLQVAFNGLVQSALLRFDQAPDVDLTVAEKLATGSFTVTRDDSFVVDAMDAAGRRIENSPRYFVRAAPDTPPEISMTMPGRDMRVMALEEVRIKVAAADDYGLTRLSLKYNVGGSKAYDIDLFKAAGQTDTESHVEAKQLLYLEDLQVTPGDIISYFVAATDNNGVGGPAETMSDIYFLEVINTDEAFQRASGLGGGMGQGGRGRPPSALVENQKNIIAATWKLLMRQRGTPGEGFEDDVGVVAESQQSLAQRTEMSLSRLTERFSFADESYDRSVLHLKEAVDRMQTAAEKLTAGDLEAALGPEQAALQAILKAEAQSRLTAVQMASNSGGAGGGGGAQREREDLRELFAMEMGRLENRYEMPRTADSAASAEQDEALRRLRELARRQERLNRAQSDAARRKERMTASEQRRRLEELRREQETLRREAQSLAQRWSRQAGSRLSRSRPNALDQAVDRMQETARNLEQGHPGDAAASGRAALQRLIDQEKGLQRRSASVNDLVKTLAEKAAQLKAQESGIVRQVERARSAAEPPGSASRKTATDTRDPLADILSDIVAKKDDLKRSLKESEALVRALASKSKASQPEIARRARDAQRALISETLQKRIEESKADLEPGRLAIAMEKESAIDQSIARLGRRLASFDALVPKSGEEQLRAAADAAEALARELESLRHSVEALRMRQRQPARLGGEGAADQGGDANRISDGLERSRRLARGLVQPWTQGEDWSADARSIHRELTRAQIEDFLNQPALWQKLMAPVRELASALREQLELKQLGDTAFAPAEPPPPPQYESMVEDYYRSLSETQ